MPDHEDASERDWETARQSAVATYERAEMAMTRRLGSVVPDWPREDAQRQ
jgi:hypothetical protein